MINVLINGISGQMGHALCRMSEEFSDTLTISCGVDPVPSDTKIPVYASFDCVHAPFDVVIDFSIPSASMKALDYCVQNLKPIVLCTTGFNEEQITHINESSAFIPIFRSANMSIGINLLCSLAKQAARMLGNSFDIEIVETHHNRKIDSPSGTAAMLAEAITSACVENKFPVYGRHDNNHRREPEEIGIHSLRGGTVVGEHEILFLGPDEVITLKHQAQSKAVFASGALRAASFLVGKEPGMYDMSSIVDSLF